MGGQPTEEEAAFRALQMQEMAEQDEEDFMLMHDHMFGGDDQGINWQDDEVGRVVALAVAEEADEAAAAPSGLAQGAVEGGASASSGEVQATPPASKKRRGSGSQSLAAP